MIYLENSTNIQTVYIPRQEIKKDALTKYVTENELDDAIANETARTEETYMKKGEMPDMSAYTPTSGFSTINGSAITNGDNLEIDGASYSAGTNISIDEDNVISVTGITVPTKLSDLDNDEGFVDSGDVQTQIDNSISGKADEDAFSAYTPTSGFSTINGSAITDGSNIVVEETPYSGGTNIEITDHVISVTGITVPTNVSDLNDDIGIATTAWTNSAITDATSGLATEQYVDYAVSGKADTTALTQYYTSAQTDTAIENATSGKADTSAFTEYWTSAQTESAISSATEDFVTSADVETQITDKGYITGYTETDPVFQASAASGITSEDITNWNGKLDSSALTEYYTSAQTDTAINNAVSGKADSSRVDEVEEVTAIALNNLNNRVDTISANTPDLTPYWTSAETQSAITDSISGKADASRLETVERVTSIALNDLNTRVDEISGTTPDLSAYTPTSGFSTINGSAITDGSNIVISGGGGDMSQYWTSAETQSAITNSVSGKADSSRVDEVEEVTAIALNSLQSNKQETLVSGTNIKTINNLSLLGSGNINIQGGSGGTNIIELTQAEYDALTAYTEDAVYVITDAEEINLSDFITTANTDYWTSAQTESAITESTSGKADAASTTARNGNYFPYWNSQGIITGSTTQALTNYSQTVNGNTRYVANFGNGGWGNIYAPTTAGSQGQIAMSNGSGAPVWSSFKFAFMTQAEYDLITPDSSTIYFITD